MIYFFLNDNIQNKEKNLIDYFRDIVVLKKKSFYHNEQHFSINTSSAASVLMKKKVIDEIFKKSLFDKVSSPIGRFYSTICERDGLRCCYLKAKNLKLSEGQK